MSARPRRVLSRACMLFQALLTVSAARNANGRAAVAVVRPRQDEAVSRALGGVRP